MKRTIFGAMVGLCAFTLAAGCATSSYQTAKMLPPGATRVSAALSNYQANADGDSSGEPAYEVMGSYGLSDRMEMGGKLAFFDTEAGNVYHVLVVPKFSITPNEIAVVVPAGVMLSDDDDSEVAYELLPGIVYTRQINPDFELDVTGQTLIMINQDMDDTLHYFGANVGLQLSPGGAAWALHPEVGLLIPVGDAADGVDYFLQFGFAFHYRFGGVAAPPMTASAE